MAKLTFGCDLKKKEKNIANIQKWNKNRSIARNKF